MNGLNWSQEDLTAHMARMVEYSKGELPQKSTVEEVTPCPPSSHPAPIIPKDPMNKTERAFADYCEIRKHLHEILDWMFEPFKLILEYGIPKCRNEVTYKPDFLVVTPREFEIVEVKARRGDWSSMRDDARAKVNIASGKFPWFRFKVAYLEKGEWSFEALN